MLACRPTRHDEGRGSAPCPRLPKRSHPALRPLRNPVQLIASRTGRKLRQALPEKLFPTLQSWGARFSDLYEPGGSTLEQPVGPESGRPGDLVPLVAWLPGLASTSEQRQRSGYPWQRTSVAGYLQKARGLHQLPGAGTCRQSGAGIPHPNCRSESFSTLWGCAIA